MKKIMLQLNNEEGSAIVIALIIMVLLLVMGISATNMSTIELQIIRNTVIQKQAFYSAEAAREYVPPNTALYYGANVTTGAPLPFPGPGTTEKIALSPTQSFNGTVEYVSAGQPPRGSGYEAGKYQIHTYNIIGNGYVKDIGSDAQSAIDAGFYRVGF